MKNIFLMQVLQSKNDARNKEFYNKFFNTGLSLSEFFITEVVSQISPFHEVKY